ncbi:potassium channel protein, partial [Candidatus Gracilibacteria bacterium]|nr:potassium channel protein [Candidatus Gracilibacteria bacterium]
GRLFTIGLILAGAGIVAYVFSSTASFFFSVDWQNIWLARRRQHMIAELNQHTIVCGYGRIGKHLTDELLREKRAFIIIDPDPAKIEHVRAKGFLALEGNAADEDLLAHAGIRRASNLVATANSDAENVFIVLTARSLRPDLLIVARANYDDSEPKLRRAGADRVIQPYRICGRRMASIIARPGVADFFDEVMHADNLELLLDEIVLAATSSLCGSTLVEAQLRSRFGVTVLAGSQPGSPLSANLEAETKLQPGVRLIVLGTREQIQALASAARQ